MRYLRIFLVVMIIAYVVYGITNNADRDDSGNIISEGQIDAFAMRVGDCFDDTQDIFGAGPAGAEVQDLPGLPCSDPHDNEVYAVFDVSFATFPGDQAMLDVATDGCFKRFAGFVGRSFDESILDILPIYPTDASWSQLNDREIICAVYHIDGKKLTGSVKGSGA